MIVRFLLAAVCWKIALSGQCYSCSSPQLHLKWIRDLMPVVDCKDSVCIKVVIKQPPAERSICETGGAIVRDCWSRVFSDAVKNPRARHDVVRLAQTPESEETVGIIYTCEGFLCNATGVTTLAILLLPFMIRQN